MRNWIQIIENALGESYEDDTDAKVALVTDPDINLTARGFVAERDELIAQYVIEDEEIIDAVKLYTTDSSLNQSLIAGKKLSKKHQELHDGLMKLKKLGCKLGEEHHFYSGTGLFDPTDIVKRGVFSSPAFLSTSISMKVAAKNTSFRRDEADEDRDHILHFILPKGYEGAFFIGGYSEAPEELEMLIFPNQKFEIIETKLHKIDGIDRQIHTAKPI